MQCFFDTPGVMLKKNGIPYRDIRIRNQNSWSSMDLYDVLLVIFDVHRHITRFDFFQLWISFYRKMLVAVRNKIYGAFQLSYVVILYVNMPVRSLSFSICKKEMCVYRLGMR